MKEKICVILVNYNGREYNEKCIQSIFANNCHGEISILVIDNASTDDSLADLNKLIEIYKNFHIICMEKNVGFAKANNLGIKWALEHGYEYIMLLNNDTEIEPQTIEKMLELQKRTGNIIVPKIFYADKPEVIWYAGGVLSPIIMKPKHRGAEKVDKGQYDDKMECTFANGCCILLTREIISRVGVLDERFFLYYEDTEYSIRAKKHGIGISFCKEAIVYHKVNGSTKGNLNSDNAYYISRNWLICNKQHMQLRFFVFYLYFILNRLCWSIIWLVRGNRDMIRAAWRGVRDFHLGKTDKIKDKGME